MNEIETAKEILEQDVVSLYKKKGAFAKTLSIYFYFSKCNRSLVTQRKRKNGVIH